MNDKLYTRSFNLLIIYALWLTGYMGTIYANQSIANLMSVVLFCSLVITFFRVKSEMKSPIVLLWLPFILWQVVAYIFQMHAERFLCWGSCFIMLLIGNSIDTSVYLKSKVFLYTGFIAIIGVWIQFLFPGFYFSNIGHLFVKENLESLFEIGYGISGFTHNIALTAIQIVYGLGAYLYLSEDKANNKKKILLYMVFLFTTFMTGKRSCMLVAALAPFTIKLIIDRISSKNFVKSIVGLSVGVVLFIALFLINSDLISDIPGVQRIFATFQDVQSQEDVSSNRFDLWAYAIELFRSNPVFGVGVGGYIKVGGIGTDTHNAYLQILCEQGIIGFLLFVIPIIYCLSNTIKKIKLCDPDNRNCLFYSLFIQLVFFLISFFSNPTINQFGYMMYFFAVSAICNYQKYKI